MNTPFLSDAILLGSMITEPRPGNLNHCALGMAANAIALPEHDKHHGDNRWVSITAAWPWLKGFEHWNRIAHTFNTEVCPWGHRPPTRNIEQLADMVRQMEPKCPCHRFNCDCLAPPVLKPSIELTAVP